MDFLSFSLQKGPLSFLFCFFFLSFFWPLCKGTLLLFSFLIFFFRSTHGCDLCCCCLFACTCTETTSPGGAKEGKSFSFCFWLLCFAFDFSRKKKCGLFSRRISSPLCFFSCARGKKKTNKQTKGGEGSIHFHQKNITAPLLFSLSVFCRRLPFFPPFSASASALPPLPLPLHHHHQKSLRTRSPEAVRRRGGV